MPKRHQEPVLVFKELKPKCVVSARQQWSVSSPRSCELKPQALPSWLKTRTAEEQQRGKVWSVPALAVCCLVRP